MIFLVPTNHICDWQKGIDENWAAALEYNPEAFARVVLMIASFSVKVTFLLLNSKIYIHVQFFQVMLYVDMEVNGVPLKVLIWYSNLVLFLLIALSTCQPRLGK